MNIIENEHQLEIHAKPLKAKWIIGIISLLPFYTLTMLSFFLFKILLQHLSPYYPFIFFAVIIPVITFYAYILYRLIKEFLWQIFGKEIIIFKEKEMIYIRKSPLHKKEESFTYNTLSNLKIYEFTIINFERPYLNHNKESCRIHFDYDNEKRTIMSEISVYEAIVIFDLIKKHNITIPTQKISDAFRAKHTPTPLNSFSPILTTLWVYFGGVLYALYYYLTAIPATNMLNETIFYSISITHLALYTIFVFYNLIFKTKPENVKSNPITVYPALFYGVILTILWIVLFLQINKRNNAAYFYFKKSFKAVIIDKKISHPRRHKVVQIKYQNKIENIYYSDLYHKSNIGDTLTKKIYSNDYILNNSEYFPYSLSKYFIVK